jgi:hypothetical protein
MWIWATALGGAMSVIANTKPNSASAVFLNILNLQMLFCYKTQADYKVAGFEINRNTLGLSIQE